MLNFEVSATAPEDKGTLPFNAASVIELDQSGRSAKMYAHSLNDLHDSILHKTQGQL